MNNFEDEVQYFIDLIKNNINLLTSNNLQGISKEEMIFFNWNMSKDGQEVAVYNQEEDMIYIIHTKNIQDFEFKYVNKDLVLNTISLLTKYINNEISFKNFLHAFNKEH